MLWNYFCGELRGEWELFTKIIDFPHWENSHIDNVLRGCLKHSLRYHSQNGPVFFVSKISGKNKWSFWEIVFDSCEM